MGDLDSSIDSYVVLEPRDYTIVSFQCQGCGFWYEFLVDHLWEIAVDGKVGCMWCDRTIHLREELGLSYEGHL